MRRLNPLNDFILQQMLGVEGAEISLLSFYNAALALTELCFTSIRILENKNLTPDIIGDKLSILDIRAIADETTRADMEIQQWDKKDTDRRSLHYWSNDFRRSIKAGELYKDLPDTIAINILNFPHIPLDDFHTSFHLYEDRHKEYRLTNALEIHFIDMTQFRKLLVKDMNDPLHRWLMFLDQETHPSIIQELIKMDYGIQLAQEKMDRISMDSDAMRYYELRQIALNYHNLELKEREERGIQQGIQQEKFEIARKGKALGIPIEQITQMTGLSPEMIALL